MATLENEVNATPSQQLAAGNDVDGVPIVTHINGILIPLDEDGKPVTAYYYNAPDSGHWFTSTRGERLHVRRFLPDSPADLKCVVLFLHGYGAHVNSTTPRAFGKAMAAAGVGVFMYDYVGHGHSQGERAYVANYLDWVEDAVLLLKMVVESGCDVPESQACLGADAAEWGPALKAVPFAIMGQSLGGGLIAQGSALPTSRFLGNTPHPVVLFFLRNVAARLFPLRQLPDSLERVQIPSLIWVSEADQVRTKLDQWGLPGGLGWGHNMRLGTGLQLLDMLDDIRSNVEKVAFPFAVIHDPEDGVVLFEGTQLLLARASTAEGVYRGRELYELRGLKHDLLTNAGPAVVDFVTQWLRDRLEHSASDLALWQGQRYSAGMPWAKSPEPVLPIEAAAASSRI
ncbi:Alpha/Beta hydrolase protein [Tribonema minus]|uniref:Alpha/Beta hydrolase protein n=1 Tax=Tribonema minus TaxID=303371 RepID=A0A835Z2I8_9STRA|nr:Alpha/Beta hydrolase protein [Tribonema minus]